MVVAIWPCLMHAVATKEFPMAKNASTTNQLTVSVRTETGKGASRRARRAGRVPAVLYGHGTEPQHLELPAHDFAAVLRHSGTNAVLTLDIEGKEQLALTKALEIHPIRRTIQHADLLVVRRGEKVTVEVNVVIEGDAASGTLVTQDATAVEIEAEALSIPEQLTVSIEGAEAGTQFTAGALEPKLRARKPARPRPPSPSKPSTAWPSHHRYWWSAWATRARTTPAPGTMSASWSSTCSPSGSGRRSSCTRNRVPTWPPGASVGARWCWPGHAAT